MVTRAEIEQTLASLNAAENSTDLTAEEKSSAIDELSRPDVQGWANGAARGGRDQEREQEAFLFSAIDGYHREFERVVIEPPDAAFSWRLTGRLGVEPIGVVGSTLIEFDESARIKRFWLYFDDPLR